MNYNVKAIIKNANLAYSNGIVYVLSEEERITINRVLELNIQTAELDDSIYDIIYNEAKKRWPTDKFFHELQAENTGYGKEITHTEPMGSMEELKEGDWDKWKQGHHQFLQSDKLDGCSIILTYEKGKLVTAATRGRGIKGKCIMRHVPYITNIPVQIQTNEDFLVIRGELLVPKADLPIMLKEVAEVEGKEQKNGRNTIAGALNRKETNKNVFKYAHFVAYWDSVNRGLEIPKLQALGFEIPYIRTITEMTTEQALIQTVTTRLENSKYELDGIILTQIDNPEQGLETGTINPKASRKFKLGIYNNKAESTVTGITWQVSKQGKLTPVLNIEPISLCGSTIINVTGHNYKNLVDKQCGVGSKIIVKRAGLVIPYLEEVLTPSVDLDLPKDLITHVDGVDLWLSDDTDEVYIQKLLFFGKKLEIEQLGLGNCKKIYEYCKQQGIDISIPCNIYSIPKGCITTLIGENGKKIENSLDSKKLGITECEYAAACGAFGGGFGERLLQPIYTKYKTLIVTRTQLESVEGFEETRINQYLENLNKWQVIREYLISQGITFQEKTCIIGKFNGKVICFTGIRDKEFTKYLEDNGVTVTESFTKDVNVLIAKDPSSNSSKIEKAKKQGCKILSLEEAKGEFKYVDTK